MKTQLTRVEKMWKEAQIKSESRKDSEILQRQLQLKEQEAKAYQTEVAH